MPAEPEHGLEECGTLHEAGRSKGLSYLESLRYRQIHLDFHTSEAIPGVGSEWNKAHFQEMLQRGRVNSINIFAKCHHGWCYYPTKVPLSAMHPSLSFDLLGAMIEACHEIDAKCPVYISAGLDEHLIPAYADWIRRNPDGTTMWAGWLEPGYHEFCMNTPYLDYLIAQTEEVARNYDVDGIWLDIVGVRDCCCRTCVAELRRRGQDPRDWNARMALGREVYFNYTTRINEAIRAIKPDTLIFHNSGHIMRGDRELADVVTHQELESLPTGGWGYDHFPVSARYVHQLGKDLLGMTGKFHTSWGEFGGYKHPNALRYEAALAVANGAKFCVGDQMHPFGKLDPATYRLIGAAFAEIEQKEPWLDRVASIADVGILSRDAVLVAAKQGFGGHASSDEGAVRMLQQAGILYDVLDAQSDFSKYKVLILPDSVPVADALKTKLEQYLASGGKIFATGTSALDEAAGRFALDFGVEWRGVSEFKPEYITPRFELKDWDPAAFVIYSPFQVIEPTTASVLADRQDPFFNRDYLHFCSHQHAPNTKQVAGAAMVKTSNTVYLAFPAFEQYVEMGQNVLREIVIEGLKTLLPEPTLVTSLPAQGVQTVMRQHNPDRTVVHLLYGTPVKRGTHVEVIEDIVPIDSVMVALRTPERPKRVYLAPQDQDLPFAYENGTLQTTVPTVECHQMVVVE